MLGARSFSSPIGSTIHPGGSNCTKGTARTHRKHALRRSQQAAGAHQLPSAQAAESAPAPSKGTCFLVGGGLGPVDHLTEEQHNWNSWTAAASQVKAAKLLQSAEVCVYDDLGAQAHQSHSHPQLTPMWASLLLAALLQPSADLAAGQVLGTYFSSCAICENATHKHGIGAPGTAHHHHHHHLKPEQGLIFHEASIFWAATLRTCCASNVSAWWKNYEGCWAGWGCGWGSGAHCSG
eukprot:786249-Pelagomonas_calceolata.AAC.10